MCKYVACRKYIIPRCKNLLRTLSWCDFLWVAREANRAVQKQSKMTMLDRTWQGTHTFKAQHRSVNPRGIFFQHKNHGVFWGLPSYPGRWLCWICGEWYSKVESWLRAGILFAGYPLLNPTLGTFVRCVAQIFLDEVIKAGLLPKPEQSVQ